MEVCTSGMTSVFTVMMVSFINLHTRLAEFLLIQKFSPPQTKFHIFDYQPSLLDHDDLFHSEKYNVLTSCF